MGDGTLQVTREQVLAYRLSGHHLDRRLAPGALAPAADACGIGNSPPTSAALALWARVAGLRPVEVEDALVRDRSLVQAWSVRGAPLVFPSAAASVFTRELEPADESELRAFLPGWVSLLDQLGMPATALVDAVTTAASTVLDGRTVVGKAVLDAEVADAVRPSLAAPQIGPWDSPSGLAAGQTVGQALVSFALRVVSLRGVVCFAGRNGRQPTFVRTDQWLGAVVPAPASAGAGLVVRYLRCYGPSSVADFASWAGIGPAQAARLWAATPDLLVAVVWDGRKGYVPAAEMPRLRAAAPARTVRLLPPLDPWVQQRDRSTVLADRALHARVWRTIGWPGTILVDGRIAGVWHAGPGQPEVELFEPLDADAGAGLEDELVSLATFRGDG